MSEIPDVKAELEKLSANFKHLKDLEAQIKEATEAGKGAAELKQQVETISTANADLVKKIEEFNSRLDESEAKANRMGEAREKSFAQQIVEGVKSANLTNGWSGHHEFEAKAITNLSASAGDLLRPQYIEGNILPYFETPRVRQLLGGGTTQSTVIIYGRVKDITDGVEYQEAQGDLKGDSDITWETKQALVRDIAHWIPVAKQMLDDVTYLQGEITSIARSLVTRFVENEILNGEGGDDAMEGLNTAATAFDTDLLDNVTDPSLFDRILAAHTQVALRGVAPTATVLNHYDWLSLATEKDANDRYMISGPSSTAGLVLWGVPVVLSSMQPAGEFLTGAFREAAQYWEREGITVAISTEDRDNFVKNMVTLRAETRGTTAIRRPYLLVNGDVAPSGEG